MPIAPGRQAEERQGSEKGAEFVNGPPLQKHQRSGRRSKRLRSNGHRISCSGPAPYVATAGQMGQSRRRVIDRIVPQRNNLSEKLGNSFSAYKRNALQQNPLKRGRA